jgi:hypothetical protein
VQSNDQAGAPGYPATHDVICDSVVLYANNVVAATPAATPGKRWGRAYTYTYTSTKCPLDVPATAASWAVTGAGAMRCTRLQP